jgi:hypothetical protein
MERTFVAARERPPRRNLYTLLRVAGALLLFWAFLSGGSLLTIQGPAILAMATALSLLAAYELSIRDAPAGWVLGWVAGIIGAGAAGYAVWLYTRPPEPTGPLLAANDPMPPMTCRGTPAAGDLVMALGTDRMIGKGPGPFSPLTVDDCMVMSLRREKGGLMIRAFFYDWNNDIAFSVMDNVYEPSMPLALRPFRPDPYSYVLLDRFDKEVLYVRYLNRNAVRIRGRFLCGTQPQAIIHDDEVLVGGIRIGGVFLGQRPTHGRVCATQHAGEPGIRIQGR